MSSLEEFLGEVAAEVDARSDGAEYKRDGRPFAAVEGNTVEFRLDPEVAEAVLNTPATQQSKRGPAWIQLSVSADAPHDLDRVRAWFLSAFRNAERG